MTPDATTTATPVVSMLMPVYNEEASVAEAVASALSQSVDPVELLVVDGRSADATVDIVRRLAEADPRVRLLDNPGRTIPCALNIGLAAARADVVARVDAHLTINPDYVATGLAVLAEHPEVAAVGGRRVGVADSATGQAVAAALSSPYGVGDSINHYATEPQETDHASMGVYRTAVLREVGGWDESLRVNEDVDIDHRILATGRRIRYHPDMVMLWSVRESLRDFGRQYRRYGRGKAGMVRKNGPAAVRPRHLAPPGLLGMLTTSALAGVTGHPRVAVALALPYAAVLTKAVSATDLPGGRTPDGALRLAGAFATMHLAWGLGFTEGLLLGAEPALSSGRAPGEQGSRLTRALGRPRSTRGSARA
ncbi:Glycosyl transferase family 2 [Nocardioides scoriae]|uniref:Glycosyl transferase family 2 n=1 Tax=Nocardioides scoriae TaxID=642780 RepID=A0A1H1TH15_9ACTN|nr:glycosyltransferase [Nocardioides scoriae]SDS59512.1 Glycosyl transferase family 2 [Nocardioides scoriae]